MTAENPVIKSSKRTEPKFLDSSRFVGIPNHRLTWPLLGQLLVNEEYCRIFSYFFFFFFSDDDSNDLTRLCDLTR